MKKVRDGILQAEVIPVLLQHIPGSKTAGWRETCRLTFAQATEVVGMEDDFSDALDSLPHVPDAYLADAEAMALHFFEVEVMHPMTDTKLKEYARFVTVMDFYGIEFAVFVVNSHGHINQVDLLPHYLRWLKEAEAQGRQDE